MADEIVPFAERRRHRRYPLGLAMDYRLRSGGDGRGVAGNMSSTGICFHCGRELPPGELIEVVLQWPVQFDGDGQRMLCLHGMIVRSSPENTAMIISKHEFRAATH